MIFGSWNHRKRRPTQGTRHQGTLEAPGAWWWVVPSSNVGWGSTSGARKLISGKKSCLNLSAIVVTDLPEYKKQFLVRSGERETEENREGDPISEGLPPLRGHVGHDQRGNSPPI